LKEDGWTTCEIPKGLFGDLKLRKEDEIH
jgi:hypothetical protein